VASVSAITSSNCVLAIQLNSTSTSATVSDVNPSLQASGSFTVPAISPAGAPVVGTYQIGLILRVVDSQGYSASSSVVLSLVISEGVPCANESHVHLLP
jgi:hypothetical protein